MTHSCIESIDLAFSNSIDQDEMLHNVSSYHGLHLFFHKSMLAA